jgi:hypothetical protein
MGWTGRSSCLLLLACAATVAADTLPPAHSWWPLDSNRPETFSVSSERVTQVGTGRRYERFLGSSVYQVVSRRGTRRVLRRTEQQTESNRHMAGVRGPVELQWMEVSSDRGRLLLHGQRWEDQSGVENARYEPALLLLEAGPEHSASWRVGRLERGGLQMALEGRSLGTESVEAGGQRHADCWKVRLEGPISGILPDGQRVSGGRLEWTLWLKQGLGPVREEQRQETRIVSEGGQPVTLSWTVRRERQASSTP